MSNVRAARASLRIADNKARAVELANVYPSNLRGRRAKAAARPRCQLR